MTFIGIVISFAIIAGEVVVAFAIASLCRYLFDRRSRTTRRGADKNNDPRWNERRIL